MSVLKDLSQSEKAVLSIALIIGATVLCALGKITTNDWLEYTKWILGIYVAGKTVTTAATAIAGSPPSSSTTAATVVSVSAQGPAGPPGPSGPPGAAPLPLPPPA